ncbi:hypothetical protein V499_08957 [Pseudogymnoascus sp. VKM F-103]|nr:hypothetical protein V499_08957 [Pseudogymnoascus sp. VKM F-103]
MAMDIPPVLSVSDTIARLRTYLDPTHQDYWRAEQHANIRKVISMYESGEVDGLSSEATIMDGKVVEREETFKDGSSNFWIEVDGEFLHFVEGVPGNGDGLVKGWDAFPVNLAWDPWG